ncbi:sensor domain-containing diguanylate cyclase [Mycolicibacterium austroafricanum]|uniref:GGDEF domain-containing protein n=1 Tax=Mycolicibacterium austroafricanum TaxID=39687 RepID=UPI000CF97318|nr:GGDEF domain-containing protein [Mycolicibacterium austroafricanum]PQP50594.1 GGDEF domain-containing protein [Mycolicibacterium austroafricanum]
MLGWWRGWWQRSDQFDWFSAYLRDRGLQVRWRMATFVFTVLLVAVPVVMVGSPAGPGGPLQTWIVIGASVSALAASLLWLFRWPSRAQSLAYSTVCSVSIAAGCLAIQDPYAGLMGCTMFAAIGGFVAYFHALAHVVANLVVALSCATINAVRILVETDDIRIVAGSAALVLGLNLGVPFGIHTLVHSLHIDLRDSDRDPLTGLLNRRSFYNMVRDLIAARRQVNTPVNVTMVDLDDFKLLNDTHGHAVGDAALVSVAAVLQEHTEPGTVLGRLGGEEFVIADVDAAARHAITAERIRRGIAATPFQITASFGICSTTVAAGAEIDHPGFLDRLIRAADAAMYQSKRAGGNRVVHDRLDIPG